jgi:hypothetical protein
MSWFLGGGISMVFVLVFGLVAIASAGRFAASPSTGRSGAMIGQGLAVLSAGAAGVLMDLTAVAFYIAGADPWPDAEQLIRIVATGFGESTAPGVLALSLVAVQSLLVAFGMRRLPA